MDYRTLNEEAAKWREAAYLSELEEDEAAPLWHRAADRATEKLEAFEAGRKSVLEHLPRECKREYLQQLISETEQASKREPGTLDDWLAFQKVHESG